MHPSGAGRAKEPAASERGGFVPQNGAPGKTPVPSAPPAVRPLSPALPHGPFKTSEPH